MRNRGDRPSGCCWCWRRSQVMATPLSVKDLFRRHRSRRKARCTGRSPCSNAGVSSRKTRPLRARSDQLAIRAWLRREFAAWPKRAAAKMKQPARCFVQESIGLVVAVKQCERLKWSTASTLLRCRFRLRGAAESWRWRTLLVCWPIRRDRGLYTVFDNDPAGCVAIEAELEQIRAQGYAVSDSEVDPRVGERPDLHRSGRGGQQCVDHADGVVHTRHWPRKANSSTGCTARAISSWRWSLRHQCTMHDVRPTGTGEKIEFHYVCSAVYCKRWRRTTLWRIAAYVPSGWIFASAVLKAAFSCGWSLRSGDAVGFGRQLFVQHTAAGARLHQADRRPACRSAAASARPMPNQIEHFLILLHFHAVDLREIVAQEVDRLRAHLDRHFLCCSDR